MQTGFTGVWIPIITPFDGEHIDHTALAKLARHLAAQGIAGLVVGATTGEGILLEPAEQEALLATLRSAVPGLPLVLGLSTASTRDAVQRARALARLQPQGLLVTPPLYVRPSQEGIRRHIEEVVQAADLPVLVYNIPYRTGCQVELETLQQLARDPRVAGLKECGGNHERMQRLVAETPLSILSGDDSQNFMALCLGAHGVIAASAHVMPHWHVRMQALIRDGQLAQARRIADALQPVVRDLFAEPSPAGLKALLAEDGWCTSELRLPFLPASANLQARLRQHRQALLAQSF
ncbi:4-hydroxy-tetrahydrodipicolinate synthase [Herbaspirillum sp. NPDC087042]|uniref:4-hydroxy-tetrahydrodipicolinate synthase n=1 Tax=Herbaspirillum sp. NPDC087042 TaxID=3364004 RepID=UPI0037FCBF9C